MPVQENRESSLIHLHLSEAHSKAESGDFGGALESVREAKSLEPKNVYILAFEKQTEQLHELASSHSLTEEQKSDILESLPSIIERALESPSTPEKSAQANVPAGPLDAQREKLEKAAALDWLKNQYFQHAHEYVRKGEYQHALAEIRRVYIIDADNRTARDFEKQITELSQRRPDQRPKTQTTLLGAPPPTQARPPKFTSGDSEATPMMTEEWSSPQQLRLQPRNPPPKAAAGKKKSNSMLFFLIFVALVGLALALLWYYQRNVLSRKPAQNKPLPPPAAESFQVSPSNAPEQNYLVSSSSTDTNAGGTDVTELAKGTSSSEEEMAVNGTEGNPAPGTSSQLQVNSRGAPPTPSGQEGRTSTSSPLMALQSAPSEASFAGPKKTETDTATPQRFVAVEKEARIVKLNRPKFSDALPPSVLDGTVVIQVQIDTLGRPIQTLTLKATNDLLIRPVIDAVMTSQYAPAEMSSGPVTSWLTIPFKFVHQ